MAASMTATLGFDESRRSDVGIIVTELGTNLVRHAHSGELILRSISYSGLTGVELLSVDRGPGIPHIANAMQDGFTTGSTPGNGLGAVQRLSDDFDIYTQPKTGTVLLSRVWSAAPPQLLPMTVGTICLPKPGEEACGDSWHVEHDAGRTVVLLADGLGHGVQAAEASRQAVKVFREHFRGTSARIVELIHAGLRSTRGAAVAVADIRRDQGKVYFTGVGNISASIVDGATSRSMVSQNGTAGAEARRIQEFTYPWDRSSILVMHSDGLGSKWVLGNYSGLRIKDRSIIAAMLYRDFRRERDDVTVLVASQSTQA
jgi:anti-sigma regulatory factor (Ser/Thr protein kinase)